MAAARMCSRLRRQRIIRQFHCLHLAGAGRRAPAHRYQLLRPPKPVLRPTPPSRHRQRTVAVEGFVWQFQLRTRQSSAANSRPLSGCGSLAAPRLQDETDYFMNVLAIDIGGTNIKILASGQKEPHKFPSGPTLSPRQMVDGVKKVAVGWNYDVFAISR